MGWDKTGTLATSGGGLAVTDLGGGRWQIVGTSGAPVTDLGDGRWQIGD